MFGAGRGPNPSERKQPAVFSRNYTGTCCGSPCRVSRALPARRKVAWNVSSLEICGLLTKLGTNGFMLHFSIEMTWVNSPMGLREKAHPKPKRL